MSNRILIVDDDKEIRSQLSVYLIAAGYQVDLAEDLPSFFNALQERIPGIVLLDFNLGDTKGSVVLQEIRKRPECEKIPVIVVTGFASEPERVELLKMGADDIVQKPFSLEELRARILANLRRANSYAKIDGIFTFGNMQLNKNKLEFVTEGQAIRLTNTEFKILFELVSANGSMVSRRRLVANSMAWGVDLSRSLDVHINSLRKKLLNADTTIRTLRGKGYSLE
ncbi:MAG: response regulator transcription factor [Bdellovibrionales bacterium]|nr:response regulator transcription factor [Bdellovibrionales bacterium]